MQANQLNMFVRESFAENEELESRPQSNEHHE